MVPVLRSSLAQTGLRKSGIYIIRGGAWSDRAHPPAPSPHAHLVVVCRGASRWDFLFLRRLFLEVDRARSGSVALPQTRRGRSASSAIQELDDPCPRHISHLPG